MSAFFTEIWRLFSGIQVPYLGISFATMYLGLLAISVSLFVLRSFFGIASSIVGVGSRAGQNVKYKLKSQYRWERDHWNE